MRLIDADALEKILEKIPAADIKNMGGQAYVLVKLSQVFNVIDNQPTIEPEPHWIPCSERLPVKDGEMYLVTISDGSVYSFALQWDINRKRWYLSFLNDGEILIKYIDDVIAWMPLPDPYQGEGEQE